MQEEYVLGPSGGPTVEGAAAGPALEPRDARVGHWYRLEPVGVPPAGVEAGAEGEQRLPEPRVGHTTTWLPAPSRKVVFVGGASPCALYSEVWQLDTRNLRMTLLAPDDDENVPQRYEHCAYTQESGDKVWIFAGANMEGNLNDLWELDLGLAEGCRWRPLQGTGTVPEPRTLHTNTAAGPGVEAASGSGSRAGGNELLVFGGGCQAASPVVDPQVYRLDSRTLTWSVVSTQGTTPAPRQGHILVAVNGKLVCHGGMAGNKFFSDLHILADGIWEEVNLTEAERVPSARAGHGAVVLGHEIFIFGGLGPDGSLNDMWKFNTDTSVWEEIVFASDCPRPKPRLDFAMSVVWLPSSFTPLSSNGKAIMQNGSQVEDLDSPGVEKEKDIPFIFLHGGMDDLGTIYDDFHVFRLNDS